MIHSYILRSIIYSNFDDEIFILTSFTGKCKLKLRLCEKGQCLLFNFELKHNGSVSKCELRLRNEFQRVPLSSTPSSVQHISSTQKGHSFSAPRIPQFNTTPLFHTKNPSVQHIPSVPQRKTLSSTQKKLYISQLRGVC